MGLINLALFVLLEYDDRKRRAAYNRYRAPRKNAFVRFGESIWGVIVWVTTPIRRVLEYPLLAFRHVSKTFGGWKCRWGHKEAVQKSEKDSGSGHTAEKVNGIEPAGNPV